MDTDMTIKINLSLDSRKHVWNYDIWLISETPSLLYGGARNDRLAAVNAAFNWLDNSDYKNLERYTS